MNPAMRSRPRAVLYEKRTRDFLEKKLDADKVLSEVMDT